ncbi:restriction endonuclease subunit S [Streptococcus pseudopneumoniae]|uniref:restriction endonuclease subunit S n=1 Tax=Streptococcus pseudopneumoniae TaxID=257758 RepID=UPI0009BAA9C1|nr:restriction endonuclease subunit S [Streptococcus pseudopneumoniae]
MSSIRLGEIGKILMCKRILKSQTNEFSGIPFYKISTFGGTPTVYIDEKIYREYKEKYSYPKKGDILISAAGTIGKTVIFDGEDSYFQDSNIVWIENDESKVTNQFLYYFLQTNPFITTNGSTIKRLYNDNLRDTKIPNVPSIQQQNQITDILGALDKKIQINNQINQELETMGKALYDYWFVQFDFPDQNGKPYKSSGGKMVYHPELKREIPEGWGVGKLSSLLEIGRETINPMKTPKEEFKYYSIPEYDVSGSFSYELGETIRSNKFIVEKSDLLVSKLNPWFNRVVYNLEENAISSTEFIVWKTFNRSEKNFLYQVATSKGFIEYCTRFATGTSNSHKRVSPDIMVGFQIPFEKMYIQKFGEITDSIRTQVLHNNVQNQELTQLRDWLLPMLMNGQVKVE